MVVYNSINIYIIFCSISCEKLVDHTYSIKIQNNWKDTIQFYASYSYPDTSMIGTKPILIMAFPGNYTYLDSKKEWKDVLPKDTILIYILSKDTVDAYSWDIIRAKNKILKRYILSIPDLEKVSWTVTYP